MNTILTRDFHPQTPFVLEELPLIARFYRRIYHERPTSNVASLVNAISRRLFPAYRSICRSPQMGRFEYKREGKASRVEFDGRNLQFQALYNPAFRHGYEPDICGLLDALLPEGGNFYDVGSNWGFFSLYAASIRKMVTVHAFEPLPKSFEDLNSCIQQTGLASVVTTHNLGVSSVDGEAFIQMPDGIHSGLAEITNKAGSGARILTRRLDSLGLTPPDFIKIDVEGHEINVLEGARTTLQAAWPFIVFESKPSYTSPERTLSPLIFLAELGYQLYVPGIKRRHDGQTYFIQAGWHDVGGADQFSLLAFAPETRLLFQHDVNVFACPPARQQKLLAAFKIQP